MTTKKIKNILDVVPLIILTISAISLLWKVSTSEIVLMWKHIIGLILLPINWLLFFWRHKVGVIGLGLTLLLGLFSILSYSPAISTTTLYIGKKVPIFYGQLIFLLWIVIHFIFSGRHYIGIATKRYWQALSGNKEINFD